MDANSSSPQWYRKVKPQGKVRRRVQDLKITSSSSFDFWGSRPSLDLSHNEGARLAANCLLSQGLEEYHTALQTEGEVDFLSEQEKNYFLEHGTDVDTHDEPDVDAGDDSDMEFESFCSSSQSVTQCPSVSKGSDVTEALNSKEDDKARSEPTETKLEAYFYTENKTAGLKDVVREFIRKAKKSLAVVTDSFSDVELLCDLLEASKKRFVSVHLLLDHLNLSIFTDVWQELQLQGKDFPKFSVLSIEGQTFCASTGRKLTGQVSETFIITDWTEALTGSFSFSWLSWLVHRNLAFLVKGSAVTHFLQEFERLSSYSTPVPGFLNVPLSLPIKTRSNSNTDRPKGKITSDQTDVRIWDWIEDGLKSHSKERTQMSILTPQYSRPLRQPVMQHMCMEKFTKPTLGGSIVQGKGDVLHKSLTPRKPHYQNNLVSYGHSPQTRVNQGTTGKNVVMIKGVAHPKSALLANEQKETFVSTQNKDFNHRNHHHKVHEDYWHQRQNGIITAPPGIAAGINKLREERSTSKMLTNPTNDSKKMHSFMSQERCEKQGVQTPISSAQGTTYGLQNTVTPSGMKTQTQPTRNHFLQSQTTMRSPPISAQTKLESNFSPPTGNNKAALQSRPTQVKPSSRLSWMTQNNTARRPMTRPVSFYSYETVPKMEGQRHFHSASAKPLARSKSMTERTTTHINFK